MSAEKPDEPQTPATPNAPHLEQVHDILTRHDIDADPAEICTRAADLARHDAGHAQYQAGHAGGMTARLLGYLRTILSLAGPTVVFLLQPIPEIPPLSRYALIVFTLTGVSTYLYTFRTGSPRITRTPGPDASGWLGVVGIPRNERTPERYLEHYVLRAVDLVGPTRRKRPTTATSPTVGTYATNTASRPRRSDAHRCAVRCPARAAVVTPTANLLLTTNTHMSRCPPQVADREGNQAPPSPLRSINVTGFSHESDRRTAARAAADEFIAASQTNDPGAGLLPLGRKEIAHGLEAVWPCG
ncbi:hypothetical protein [Umezawaea sp. Da 62-37]|uniref:hypothetical protein n=1 Tax=Umezawaea sp. Da 62-37 TaxID=3075927 RepID=UPI0028F71856|nr:hypothetical protein [Umezawaea sp. Da 62-37]WNV85029.1 hypothetical protein RM788_43935 [Umezawaea sp. Da 62-37]